MISELPLGGVDNKNIVEKQGELIMELRTASSPKDVKYYTTERLREEFLIDDDLAWRVENLAAGNFLDTVSLRLFKRDFLLENKIFFPENVARCEDVVWKYAALFLAKRIVHLPFVNYFYRMAPNSLTRQKRTPAEYINSRMTTIIDGIKWIDDIMNKSKFIKKNPEYRYKILEDFTDNMFWRLLNTYRKRGWTNEMVYSLIRQEFGKEFDKYEAVVPVLCSIITDYRKNIEDDEKLIAELEGRLKQGASS